MSATYVDRIAIYVKHLISIDIYLKIMCKHYNLQLTSKFFVQTFILIYKMNRKCFKKGISNNKYG